MGKKTYTKKFVDKLKQDIEDLMSYDQFERCEDCGKLHPARYLCPNCIHGKSSYCEKDAMTEAHPHAYCATDKVATPFIDFIDVKGVKLYEE